MTARFALKLSTKIPPGTAYIIGICRYIVKDIVLEQFYALIKHILSINVKAHNTSFTGGKKY